MFAPTDDLEPTESPAAEERFDGAEWGWDPWLVRMYLDALMTEQRKSLH
jgi:hypothetical protein